MNLFSGTSAESERDVLHTANLWHQRGRRVMLATVIHTWGSAPRPVGALLAVAADGAFIGSVSGGCIEDDLLNDWANGEIDTDRPSIREYGVDAEEAYRFGLPCGGTVKLVIEPVSQRSDLPVLLACLDAAPLVERRLNIETGEVWGQPTKVDGQVRLQGAWLSVCYGCCHRLLLIGANQPSAFVASVALTLGYDVIVCDPRSECADSWNVPQTTLRREMPDDVVIDMQLDERSAVIALTHDPKLDDLALMEALKGPAFYVGAIGSRKSHTARCERLKLFDVDDAGLSRLRGPAGLYIGASTPVEIGLSILADLTAHRRGVPGAAIVSVSAGKALCESR